MKKTTFTITACILLLINIAYSEEFRGGLLTINEEQDISQTINTQLEQGSIKASNMDITSKGMGQDVTFKSKTTNAYVEINGNKYTNIKEGSTVMTDRNGELKEADMTFTKDTTLKLGEKELSVEEGNRVVYQNGQIEVHGEGTLGLNNQSISINSENLTIQGEGNNLTLMGDNFTLGKDTFTGLQQRQAQVTQTQNGYTLGKNTMAETPNMKISSKSEATNLLNECQEKPNSQNYINPCGKNLLMEGKGFEVELKEGKNFGLDIAKEDTLKYGMNGGKAVLENGKQTIDPTEGDVIITNGGIKTRYTEIDGEAQSLIDAESIGEEPDVNLNTKFGELGTAEDQETGTETVYACGMEPEIQVTGAASFFDKCKSIVGINTQKTNSLVGVKWDGETITSEGSVIKRDIPSGKTLYSKIITTQDAKGNKNEYMVNSDGTIDKLNLKTKMWEEAGYSLPPEGLRTFGITEKQAAQTLAEQEAQKKPTPETKKTGKTVAEAYQDRGEELWDSLRRGGIQKGQFTTDDYFLPGGYKDGVTYLQPAPGRGGVSMIRNADFMVEPIKDRAGKITGYKNVDGGMEFKVIDGNKVKLVK